MVDFNYAGEFGEKYHRARQLPKEAQKWISQLRAEKLRKWISPEDRVLEWGVGFGWNLASLNCREKVGFDVADVRAEVERKKIRFVADEQELPNGEFDVVLAHQVLEHLTNPFNCLLRCKSLLADRGKLLVFVPLERERKYFKFRTSDRAHHLSSWTPGSLERLIVRSGWKVQESFVQRFRFDRIAALAAWRMNGGASLFRLLRRFAVLLLPEFEICVVAVAQ